LTCCITPVGFDVARDAGARAANKQHKMFLYIYLVI
jgi:hypothetical protein